MKLYPLAQYIIDWHNGNKADWAKTAGVARQHVNEKIDSGYLVMIDENGKRHLFQPPKRTW